jgi:hypothetical protein
MPHDVVRIFELIVAIGLTAAVTIMFLLVLIFIVQGFRSAGHHQ